MSEILDVKLIHETRSGSLIKSPAKIQIAEGRIYFLKAPYALKNEIKAMAGSRWHGFDDENPRKIWSVKDCPRNLFQLGYLMGEDVYAWFDRELVRHEYRPYYKNGERTNPMPHQYDMADAGLTYHYQIWGAEMGCVDGEAIVHLNRASVGFKMKLKDLYHKFHGGKTRGKAWDPSIVTHVRSLKEDTLGLHKIRNVLHQGVKRVLRLTLTSGKTIRLTPDHEVCVGYGKYCPVDKLHPGDVVFTNGTWIDKDGYVRIGNLKGKHHRWTTGGVYEHIIVMEEKLGRRLNPGERVHHKNGIKHDNRPENLSLMASDSEHASYHGQKGGFKKLHGGISANGGEVQFVPTVDTVKSVEPAGECEVYDIVCEDPHRNFVANGIVVHNCGKSLSAQMVIEHSDTDRWFWVGPARSLPNIEREFRIWGYDESKQIDFMSYERLVRLMDDWRPGDSLPQGVIFDECSKLKTASRQRSLAAQLLADRIREKYRFDGYVIEMSGTPSPKKPTDWWSLAEIAWPGFLREGSVKALEQRLAFMVQEEYANGAFWKAIGWKDDERKCEVCGKPADDPCHMIDDFMGGIDDTAEDAHKFVPSKNEVAFMYERLKGLVVIKHKKDCLRLPDKRYRRIVCTPKSSLLRVAKAIVDAASNVMTGMTLLRELSDGFQYREELDGTVACNHCPDTCGEVYQWFDPTDENRTFTNVDMLDAELVARLKKRKVTCPKCQGSGEVVKMKRFAREVPCPKEDALRDLLEENEETGRIVIFAGFTGSVDRCARICRKDGWSVVRCDGRGYQVTLANGEVITNVEALDYWADTETNPRVAFVAHPESGGMSLTLTEARMAVFWSNSYKPEYRVQAEDRIHRKGMDENLGCTIVDLIHLPTDERVLKIIRENRKLELMTMGEVIQEVEWETAP